MSDSVDSEGILQFCQITNAEPTVAMGYLQISEGNIEQAVSLFLENGGAPLEAAVPRRQASPSDHWADAGRSAQSSSYHNNANDDVRAPLAPRREVLVESGSLYDTPGVSSAHLYATGVSEGHRSVFDQLPRSTRTQEAFRDFAAESSALQSSSPYGIAGSSVHIGGLDGLDGDIDIIGDVGSSIGGGIGIGGSSSSGSTSAERKSNRLAELFRPPFDLIQNLPFDQARGLAKSQRKWILVNIQKVSEFACQVLNRDIWSDATVKEIVRVNFVFLQLGHESDEGSRYINFYPVRKYPHVAIIDPRTGERVREWNDNITSAAEFAEDVTQFLGLNAYGGSQPIISQQSKRPRRPDPSHQTRDISAMTEEEQIQAAIAASMAKEHQPTSSPSPPPSTIETASMTPPSPTTPASASESNMPAEPSTPSSKDIGKAGSESHTHNHPNPGDAQDDDDEDQDRSGQNQLEAIYHSIQANEGTEPGANAPEATTRVQFRLPNGSRVVRRFRTDTPVRDLVAFVKAKVPEANEHIVNIQYHRENLLDKLDQTVAEAGLQNASITVDA
ncbi:UBX domain protein Ubx2 [Dimargaris cristalligena]|nr:UBX domain protein Ubx2 [Dimargaris cristalligena]